MKNGCLIVGLLSLFPFLTVAQEPDGFDAESIHIDDNVGEQMMSVPSHGADDAFLRRYGRYSNNDADLLLNTVTSSIKRSLKAYMNGTASLGKGDNAPFWFTSGRQGLSPVETGSLLLDLGFDGGMRLPNGFSFNYGMNVAVGDGCQSDFRLQQMYVEAGYRWFDLSVGSRCRWGELKNPALSSGALTWSGNCRPVPQIRFEVPDFVPLGFLDDWVSLKGHLSYGWFQDGKWRKDASARVSSSHSYVDNILYHSKSLFLRLGGGTRFPLEVIWGLEMYGQFGGTAHNMFVSSLGQYVEEYSFPSNLPAYAEILLPFNVIGKQGNENGNSLGSWHLSFGFKKERWKYRLYYEHFYEDHSSMLGIEYKPDVSGARGFVFYGMKYNWFDGLFGFEVNAPDELPVRNFVIEFLNTKGQCGSVCNFSHCVPEGVDGRDAMYNHGVYGSFSSWGYSVGSPVLVSPLYNKDGDIRFKSNRTMALHCGMDGTFADRFDWRVMLTCSSHWGTYADPFTERENVFSSLFECLYRFGGASSWKTGVSVAVDSDSGALLGNNWGIMLTVSKLWKLL